MLLWIKKKPDPGGNSPGGKLTRGEFSGHRFENKDNSLSETLTQDFESEI